MEVMVGDVAGTLTGILGMVMFDDDILTTARIKFVGVAEVKAVLELVIIVVVDGLRDSMEIPRRSFRDPNGEGDNELLLSDLYIAPLSLEPSVKFPEKSCDEFDVFDLELIGNDASSFLIAVPFGSLSINSP